MSKGLLTLNAGSSSLKFAAFVLNGKGSEPALLLSGQIAGIGFEAQFNARDVNGNKLPAPMSGMEKIHDHESAIHQAIAWLKQQTNSYELVAVGHRVVHGGVHYNKPELVTAELLDRLDELSPLAPHHQPHNLAAIKAVSTTAPDLPQIACFDTAFHTTQSEIAKRLPIPKDYVEKGIQRYGFHGLSYEYIVSAVPAHNHGEIPKRMIVAHLGNGASLCGMHEGVSVVTSMGFSTLDGLMMGTRSGSLDPGVLLHLMHYEGMSENELTDFIYNQCGLLGVSGISADMQVLLGSDDPQAATAVELFCYSLLRHFGSHIAALGGLDALVFTGGIGEHADSVRSKVCEKMQWLGLELDSIANAAGTEKISTESSRIKVWVIPTNEELFIARRTQMILQDQGSF